MKLSEDEIELVCKALQFYAEHHDADHEITGRLITRFIKL